MLVGVFVFEEMMIYLAPTSLGPEFHQILYPHRHPDFLNLLAVQCLKLGGKNPIV